MFLREREEDIETEAERERETEATKQIDENLNVKTLSAPHQELLYRFENLLIVTISLRMLTLCLAPCGHFVLPTSACISDITRILHQTLWSLQLTVQQCSAYNGLH